MIKLLYNITLVFSTWSGYCFEITIHNFVTLNMSLVLFNFNTIGCDHPILKDLVIHVISSVATRWYELGLVLLDTEYHNELTIIEADIRNDAVSCCRKMFSKWLNTDELATWDKLIKAVRIVQLNDVADDIEQLLLQGEYFTDLL